jgi:hypothetical protein
MFRKWNEYACNGSRSLYRQGGEAVVADWLRQMGICCKVFICATCQKVQSSLCDMNATWRLIIGSKVCYGALTMKVVLDMVVQLLTSMANHSIEVCMYYPPYYIIGGVIFNKVV